MALRALRYPQAPDMSQHMDVQIPLWFCITCPIVLGLLAPFVFNLGFGAVAEAICEHYQLPAEDCNDLW